MEMSDRKLSTLGLAASLALAGLAIVFSQSLPYATLLIGIAALLVIATAAWSAWEWFPRILTDPERAKVAARSIYRCAARNGGTIHATHIFPVDRNPENDFAIEELGTAGTDIEIVFHRVLLLDSIEDERSWLTSLFGRLHGNIAKRFYTLSSYPLLLPRIAKAVLPRLNLILYQSSRNRSCQVLVGLDRLHLVGVSVNFALHSRSQRVYLALLRYFEQITGGPHFRSCNSIEEYDATQPASTQVQRGQAVVSKIVDCAETTPGIVFVGLFGSIARAALGLAADIAVDDTDADVDLLVVFDPRIYPGKDEDRLREHIEAALGVSRTNVTWGPDLSTFYPFRDEQRIDVDIECLPAGSIFYVENGLLGNSIFRYFMPLYSTDQRPIVSTVQVPMMPLTPGERWRRVVTDRQGLHHFKNRVTETPSTTDPRRLCTHILRNVVWAITGTWATTAAAAGQYLAGLDEWKDKPALQNAILLMGLSTQDVGRDLQKSFAVVEAMIDIALQHAEFEKARSYRDRDAHH
jgi:predicted nucleotidyltransferase